jgi:ABC-type glycerol-3-phosphate transport system substrate-binding protein
VKGINMKNKAKIAVAAGAVLASALAIAPVQAHAATPALIGSCSQGFACAWGTNNVLFWEANGPANTHFTINENVTYVENLTGYEMNIVFSSGPGAELSPHSGVIPLGLVRGGASSVYVSYIELEN